jgi:hypothetical protein
MQSELRPGEYIDEFVSGGPKNYAYRICDSNTKQTINIVCKVRGITLNYSTCKQVNFDVIRNMILGGEDVEPVTVHMKKKIKRKRRQGEGSCVVTEPEDKMYRVSLSVAG